MANFQAPIPGQSLTTAPGNMPFERPPELSDPEEALKMHLKRLSKPDMQQHVTDLLELNSEEMPMDIVQLTEGILRSAVSEGIHSIDTSIIIAPVIHDYIKRIADHAGIDYEEGFEDKDEEKNIKIIKAAKAKKMLDKYDPSKTAADPVESEEAEAIPDNEEDEGESSGGFMTRKPMNEEIA